MEYKQEIEYVVKNDIIKRADIFDFEETPNEKIYNDLYMFCRENLDTHFERKNVSHSSFLFANNFSINAKAKAKRNQNIILINIGLIQHCIEKYLYNIKLNDFIEKEKSELTIKFDSSVSHIAFQINTQFTYYHELAHLFQLSKTEKEIELQERSSEDEFDIIKHKLEINADTYSAICIATHIHQYISRIFGKDINHDIVIDTITIFGACLLEYIINFSDEFELYYDQKSHPHPVIRMLNIIMNIAYHLSEIPIYKENEIVLDPIMLFRHIIDLHGELENQKIFTSGFSEFINNKIMDIKKITSYLDQITKLNDEYIDAMYIWNKYV